MAGPPDYPKGATPTPPCANCGHGMYLHAGEGARGKCTVPLCPCLAYVAPPPKPPDQSPKHGDTK